MTASTHTQSLAAAVLRDQSMGLIRAEVRANDQRHALEAGIVQAIRNYGISIDEASEATGLRPSEIRALLASTPACQTDDLAALAGMR